MPKIETLKRREDFKEVLKRGKVVTSEYFLLYFLPNALSKNRIGFILNKKMGKISKRNLIKRRLKSAYRLTLTELTPGYDLILVGRQKILTADFQKILKTLRENLLSIMNKEKTNEN